MMDKEFHLQDHDLYRYVYDLTVQIPEGRVSTYGALARALGDLAASRAVGRVLSVDRPRPFKVPCHRVVYSNGRTGWYNGAGKGAERKQELLRSEGVPINDGKVLNFKMTCFDDFLKDPILEKMAAVQRELAANVLQEGDALAFDRIAGLDVSYDGDKAFAAMVVLDRKGVILEERVSECQVNFPYVPGYLGFREMRPYSLLLEQGRQDTLYLIDGHGRAHPRRAGIASQFGVVHDVAAGGVGKSALSGNVRSGTLYLDDEEVGRVVKGPRGKARYVSVGHKVGLDSICQLVRSLPKDPLTMAHDLCGRVRRGEEHR